MQGHRTASPITLAAALIAVLLGASALLVALSGPDRNEGVYDLGFHEGLRRGQASPLWFDQDKVQLAVFLPRGKRDQLSQALKYQALFPDCELLRSVRFSSGNDLVIFSLEKADEEPVGPRTNPPGSGEILGDDDP